MKLTWKIAKWELLRHLYNKQFLIGLLITPLMFVFFAGIPQLIAKLDKPKQETFYVIDKIGELERLQKAATGTTVEFLPYEKADQEIKTFIQEQEATGYFQLDQKFVETGMVEIYSIEKRLMFVTVEGLLSSVLQDIRLQEAGLDQQYVQYLMAPVSVVALQINAEESTTEQKGQIAVPVAVAGLVLFLIFTSGAMLLQSALQEKRDRMSEVILSSVTSDNLMQGKIIGHFLLGVLQLSLWLAIGLPVAWYFLDIPVFELLSVSQLPIFIIFALLGYLLFAALFVGIGATMTDIQSASNTQSMVFMLPMLPVVFIGPIIHNPNGTVAQLGTLFPITSPTITILRVGLGDVPTWELVAGGVLLLVTTYLVVKAAAKLFRVGMLMYGKPADVKEMIKWLRY